MDADRLSRLPLYAREYIAELERKVARAEARATAARLDTSPDESNTLLDPYDATPIGLGKGTDVRFLLAGARGDRSTEQWVDVRVRSSGVLEVQGGRGLAIIPRSSNLAYIRIED